MSVSLLALLFIALVSNAATAQIATGGSYTLEQGVIASGGGTSVDPDVTPVYSITGTAGQPAAGTRLTGTPYTLSSGFWQAAAAPTAASADIAGRVTGLENLGIKGATVTLLGGTSSVERIVETNGRGEFIFEDVEIGHFYFIRVKQKGLAFAPEQYSFTLFGARDDITFSATPQP